MKQNIKICFYCDYSNKSYDMTHYDLISQEGPEHFSVKGFCELGLRLELILENRNDDEVEITIDVHWKAFEYDETFLASNFDYYYIRHEADEECTMLPGKRKELVNEVTFSLKKGKTIFSAVSPAYSIEENISFLDKLGKYDYASVRVAGESEEGRSIQLVKISKGGKKENCLVVARCHAYETAGNYNVEGMIDFLLSGSQLADYFLERYDFHFVPVMNPDGLANGLERLTAPRGADLNRDFECNKKNNPGSENDKALITHFKIINRLKPALYLNLHNWSFKLEDGLFCFDQNVCDTFSSFMPDQAGDFKRWRKRVFGKPTGKTSPGRYCKEQFETISLVLEFPWYGRTLERMRKLGEEALTAFLHTSMDLKSKENAGIKKIAKISEA